jgi:hypothetical protein
MKKVVWMLFQGLFQLWKFVIGGQDLDFLFVIIVNRWQQKPNF